MVKFTLKGISNLTESPAYFQQVNGIYRKDGALALNMPFDINAIEKKFNSGHQKLPNIHCQQHLLTDYDECIPTNNNQLGEKTYGTV